tara:strand:+ start:5590 stop:7932 length:2343 start_codon:yes stop_codon:yes gene_type:complete
MPSQSLTDYLDARGTLWFPINTHIGNERTPEHPNGKKQLDPYNETNKRPTIHDFKTLTLQEIKARQAYTGYNLIAIDTGSKIQQIDIDDFDMDCSKWKANHPYYLSAVKKLPHIFMKFECAETEDRNKIVLKAQPKVDLLNGLWAWADKNAVVFNTEMEIQSIPVPDERTEGERDTDRYNIAPQADYSKVDIQHLLGGIPATLPYDDWIKIGASVLNSGFDYLDWYNWSAPRGVGDNDQQKPTQAKWNTFHSMDRVGFGTLLWYLEAHDPTRCKEIKGNMRTPAENVFIKEWVEVVGSTMTNKSVGQLFYNKFKNKYVFDDDWFMFDDKSGIMKKLGKKMIEAHMFGDCSDYLGGLLANVIAETTDEDFLKKLYRFKHNAETTTFIKGSFAFKEVRFKDTKFRKSLDANQELMGFENGVYDMGMGEFRKGVKTDYVSSYLDFEWSDTHDNQFFEDLIWSIFEDAPMVEWFKKHLGSIFVGGNKEELFYFWNGNGRNGKGTIDTLIRAVLGDFYTPLDATHFTTTPKEPDKPQPSLLKLLHKKVAMVIELGNDKLHSERVKLFSGSDVLNARTLYDPTVVEVPCEFKPIVQTNQLPQFTEVDPALLDRICPIHFPFRFVADHIYDKNDPTHRHGNENLKTKCKEKKVEFFNWVLECCVPRYRAEGLRPLPQKVEDNIKVFRRTIDDVSDYVETELRVCLGGRLSSNEVWDHYRHWRIQVKEKEAPGTRDNFAKRLKQIIGENKYKKITYENKQQRCILGYEFINKYEKIRDTYDDKYSNDF